MADLKFNPDTHEYSVDGARYMSVTEVLRPLYSDLKFVPEDLLQYKSEVGTAVHKAIELHLRDDLNYSSLDPLVARYFDQFLKFESECIFSAVPEQLEMRLFDTKLRLAGTLDCFGHINGRPAILDWKTTATLSPVVGLQLAGYQILGYESLCRFGARYALRLTEKNYRLVKFDTANDSVDRQAFLGLLKAVQWAKANNKPIIFNNHE